MEPDNRPELRWRAEWGIKALRQNLKIYIKKLVVIIEKTDKGDQFELMNTKL